MKVLVTGIPGSGKTTLAAPLAAALELPLLSKDAIKVALWDALGPGDRAWSRQLGVAASVALRSLVTSSSCAVVDHFVPSEFVADWRLPGVVEVHCSCPAEMARRRYAERQRHPCHFDADQLVDNFDGWVADDARRDALGPRLEVDTRGAVDVGAVVAWVRSQV